MTKLKASLPFTTADEHRRAYNIDFITKVCNEDTMMPLTILSFDLEQYSPREKHGKRNFPMSGRYECFVSHIGVSLQTSFDANETENICFCSQSNVLTEANNNIVKDLELRCFKNEAHMLDAFWKYQRESDIDALSGFNIVGYDLSVLWIRSYMYYMCQNFSYYYLLNSYRVAKSKMQEYRKIKKRKTLTQYEKALKIKEIFNISSDKYEDMLQPPPRFFALAAAPTFSQKDYESFRRDAAGIDTANFFISELSCLEIEYYEMTFESAQKRDL